MLMHQYILVRTIQGKEKSNYSPTGHTSIILSLGDF